MDKINYTLNAEKMQALKGKIARFKRKFVKRLEKSGIIKRKRVIKDYKILFYAIYYYVVKHLSFQRLSDRMLLKHGIKMSDTAWKKQIYKTYHIFFNIASELLNEDSNLKNYDKKIYAIDATDISKQGTGTVIRVHTKLSINNCINAQAIVTDNHVAESVCNFTFEKNSLILADRAYGKSKQITYLIENNADFLIRFSPSHITLYTSPDCKEKLDIQGLLKNKKFSSYCYIKNNRKVFKVRIVGAEIPEEKHTLAEKRVIRKAQKQQNKIKNLTIELAKWVLLITSLDSYEINELVDFYRQRWQIELLFKRSKSLLNFHTIRRSGPVYTNSVVYCWLSFCYYLKFNLLSILFLISISLCSILSL